MLGSDIGAWVPFPQRCCRVVSGNVAHSRARWWCVRPSCHCSRPISSVAWNLGDRLLGYLGEVSARGLKQFRLRGATTVLELDLGVLAAAANLIPQQQPLSDYPAIARDLNLIVDETVPWAAAGSDDSPSGRSAAGNAAVPGSLSRHQERWRREETTALLHHLALPRTNADQRGSGRDSRSSGRCLRPAAPGVLLVA